MNHSYLALLHDAVIQPLLNGNRKLAHFGLPLQESALYEDIKGAISEMGIVGLHGRCFTSSVEGWSDIILARDTESLEDFGNLLECFWEGNISEEETCKVLGQWFGYDEKSITSYLNTGDIFPSKKARELSFEEFADYGRI